MSITRNSSSEIPRCKEFSKEHWKAWIAAWLGRTLDLKRAKALFAELGECVSTI
jgi:hypothetical protein